MKTGISTACLYPLETEKSLELLLQLGFRLFEVFLNAEQELAPAFLKGLREKAKEYGAEFVSVHPYTSSSESLLLFGNYPRRTAEGFALYRRYLEAAAVLGAGYVVIHGQPQGHGKLSDAEYWERFGELSLLGEGLGVSPAQENVRQHRGSVPSFLQGMREALGSRCAFVLDVKQCVMSGFSIEDTARAMGNRLCHIHLSDHTAERPCLLPGEGDFDFEAFRSLLLEPQYKGAVVTEVYRDNFSEPAELEKVLRYTKNVFNR